MERTLALLLILLAACSSRVGSYTIPTPDAAEQARDSARYASLEPGEMMGAKVSSWENQTSTADPIVFDHAKWDTAGLWAADQPTRLTIPTDGFYRVEAQVTVLGSGYAGSPQSPSWIVAVIRNGDPTDFVCAENRTNENVTGAQLAGCSTVDWFLAGDYVELTVTPGRTVESNWPGRGNVSPILLMVGA